MTWRNFILHNFWLKLFSLLLATLIWFAIHTDKNPTADLLTNPFRSPGLNLPVAVMKSPGDTNTYTVSPSFVTVHVTGESAVLREHSHGDLKAYVDIVQPPATRNSSQKISLHVPDGVTVVDLSPKAVFLEIVTPPSE